jgi:hypothetical protein
MEETPSPPRKELEKAVATGTLLEGLSGTGAAVLALIAILGTVPRTLTAAGVVVLGAAILLSAGGFAAILGRIRSRQGWIEALAGGAGMEALVGAAAVAGGILVLANVVPMTLLPVSVILLGSCFLLASGGLQLLTAAPAWEASAPEAGGAAGAGAVEVVVGLAAVALGILALAGMETLLFSQVAVLSLGAGLLAKCMLYSAQAAGRIAHSSR